MTRGVARRRAVPRNTRRELAATAPT